MTRRRPCVLSRRRRHWHVSDGDRSLCLFENLVMIIVCVGILAEIWVANESHLVDWDNPSKCLLPLRPTWEMWREAVHDTESRSNSCLELGIKCHAVLWFDLDSTDNCMFAMWASTIVVELHFMLPASNRVNVHAKVSPKHITAAEQQHILWPSREKVVEQECQFFQVWTNIVHVEQ